MSLLVFFILVFSFQVHSHSFNKYYWESYEVYEWFWRPQQNSASNVKTATLLSHISPSFKSLDAGDDRSFSTVWGLWDYGTGRSSLTYQFNITEQARSDSGFCGMYNSRVSVKFYSENSTRIYISNCAEQNRGPGGYCAMRPSSSRNPTWTTQTRRVDTSNETLDLKFYTFDGKPLIIDFVTLRFQRSKTHPSC